MAQATKLQQTKSAPLPPLWEVPEYIAAQNTVNVRQQRREVAERRHAIARAQSQGVRSTTTLDDQVDKLIAGGRVIAVVPENEMEAATKEIDILTRGIFFAREKQEELKGELSFAVCSRYRKEHEDNLRAADAAASALFEALERNRVLRGRIQGAGYQLLDGAMPIHAFPIATLLGDPRVSSSPAGQFRQWLDDQGIA